MALCPVGAPEVARSAGTASRFYSSECFQERGHVIDKFDSVCHLFKLQSSNFWEVVGCKARCVGCVPRMQFNNSICGRVWRGSRVRVPRSAATVMAMAARSDASVRIPPRSHEKQAVTLHGKGFGRHGRRESVRFPSHVQSYGSRIKMMRLFSYQRPFHARRPLLHRGATGASRHVFVGVANGGNFAYDIAWRLASTGFRKGKGRYERETSNKGVLGRHGARAHRRLGAGSCARCTCR